MELKNLVVRSLNNYLITVHRALLLKGGYSKWIMVQKLHILTTNTLLKYFCKIMIGFPAEAASWKSCLAQKQTLESNHLIWLQGKLFATRVCFCAKQLFPATALQDKVSKYRKVSKCRILCRYRLPLWQTVYPLYTILYRFPASQDLKTL